MVKLLLKPDYMLGDSKFEKKKKNKQKTHWLTHSRESVQTATSLMASFNWDINLIDIKTAFLQGKKITRNAVIKPPNEVRAKKLFKLNKCAHGLADALRCWYLRLKDKFLWLNISTSKYDPDLFYYFQDKYKISRFDGFICRCYFMGRHKWIQKSSTH